MLQLAHVRLHDVLLAAEADRAAAQVDEVQVVPAKVVEELGDVPAEAVLLGHRGYADDRDPLRAEEGVETAQVGRLRGKIAGTRGPELGQAVQGYKPPVARDGERVYLEGREHPAPGAGAMGEYAAARLLSRSMPRAMRSRHSGWPICSNLCRMWSVRTNAYASS